jgi:hypothetical protein
MGLRLCADVDARSLYRASRQSNNACPALRTTPHYSYLNDAHPIGETAYPNDSVLQIDCRSGRTGGSYSGEYALS